MNPSHITAYVLIPLAVKGRHKEKFPLHFIKESYLNKLEKINLIPLLVPSVTSRKIVDALYDQADGLFLLGGSDLDPAIYARQKHPKTRVEEPYRDNLELYLVKKAITDKKPILGICRGCQVINVALGGTLIQHLPHYAPQEKHRCKNQDKSLKEKCHIIRIEDNTLLKEIIGKDEIWVTSNHHQAVDEVGRNLRVAARSPAGVIEAIEWHDKSYFCIGLQPHPEVTENSKLNAVFREFKRAVLRYAMSRNNP